MLSWQHMTFKPSKLGQTGLITTLHLCRAVLAMTEISTCLKCINCDKTKRNFPKILIEYKSFIHVVY